MLSVSISESLLVYLNGQLSRLQLAVLKKAAEGEFIRRGSLSQHLYSPFVSAEGETLNANIVIKLHKMSLVDLIQEHKGVKVEVSELGALVLEVEME